MGCPVRATMCYVGMYVSIQQHNFMQPQTHKATQREVGCLCLLGQDVTPLIKVEKCLVYRSSPLLS
jgi:hypothetical protein